MNKFECEMALCNIYNGSWDEEHDYQSDYDTLKKLIEKHFNKSPRQPKVQYAVYDNDDELLCMGNVNECCETLNITKQMFYNALHTTRREQFKKARKYTICSIEDDE